MWSKLRSRMLSLYPGFTRSPLACKRKFNTLVRHHKKYGINVPGSLSNVIEPSSDVNEKDKPSMLLAKLDGEIDPFMDSLKPTVSI